MKLGRNVLICSVAVLCSWSAAAVADCATHGFPEGREPQNPVYKVQSCSGAQTIVDQRRQADPGWYGVITYTAEDTAVEVTYANDDARRLLWTESEYWYFAGGCGAFPAGRLLEGNAILLDWKCCDLGPVRDIQCALGGTRLLRAELD